MQKILILNMNPGYDRTLTIDKPSPFPHVFSVDESITYASGKGLNVARVFSILQFPDSELINILGGEIGRLIEKQSHLDHVKASNFYISNNSRMNTTVCKSYLNQTETYNERGPHISEEEISQFIDFVKNRLPSAKGLVISGSVIVGLTPTCITPILKAVKELQIPLFVDISGPWLTALTAFSIEVLKVNEHEFLEAFHISPYDTIKIIELKKDLQITNLVITLGKKGCLAWNEANEFYHITSEIPKPPVNTLGCGDSFFAGLIVRLLQGASLFDACVFASACASANTLSKMPAHFTLEELAECLPIIKNQNRGTLDET